MLLLFILRLQWVSNLCTRFILAGWTAALTPLPCQSVAIATAKIIYGNCIWQAINLVKSKKQQQQQQMRRVAKKKKTKKKLDLTPFAAATAKERASGKVGMAATWRGCVGVSSFSSAAVTSAKSALDMFLLKFPPHFFVPCTNKNWQPAATWLKNIYIYMCLYYLYIITYVYVKSVSKAESKKNKLYLNLSHF